MLIRRQVSSNWMDALLARLRSSLLSAHRSEGPTAELHPLAPERAQLLLAVADYLRQPRHASSLASENLLRGSEQASGLSASLPVRASMDSLDDRIEALGLMASLDSGSLHPERVDFSVEPLLDRLDAAFGPVAMGKGLRWDVTPSIAKVHSNPVLLERMLSNLVDNAVRLTSTGGVVVSSRLSGACLLMQVWDTGLGIAPEHQERVFEAFFRDVPQGDRGAGLGLPIVKSGARELGIEVALRSVPGRGSCVSMRVPLTEAAAAHRDTVAAVLCRPSPDSPF